MVGAAQDPSPSPRNIPLDCTVSTLRPQHAHRAASAQLWRPLSKRSKGAENALIATMIKNSLATCLPNSIDRSRLRRTVREKKIRSTLLIRAWPREW